VDDTGGGTLFGPSISLVPGQGVEVSALKSKSATITWTTVGMLPKYDGKTTAQVEYGTTVQYGSLTKEKKKLKNGHKVVIKKLVPATTYHFRVLGFDANGFEIQSGDFTFTTKP
jgi:hypothetical protein